MERGARQRTQRLRNVWITQRRSGLVGGSVLGNNGLRHSIVPACTGKSLQHLFFVLLLDARGKNRCCGDFCGNQSCFSLLGRDKCNGRHAARVSESSIETVICSDGALAPIQHTLCYFQFVNRRSGVRIPQPAKTPPSEDVHRRPQNELKDCDLQGFIVHRRSNRSVGSRSQKG